MTKEETISKLYGLRAGLSLVVDNGQKARETKEKSKQLQSALDKTRAQLAEKYEELQEQLDRTKEENIRNPNADEVYELHKLTCLAKICSIPFCGFACFKHLKEKWTLLLWMNLIFSILVGSLMTYLFWLWLGGQPNDIAISIYYGFAYGSLIIFFIVSPIICSILPINLLCYLYYKKKEEKIWEKGQREIQNVIIPKAKEKFRQLKKEYEQESQQFAVYKNETIEQIKQTNKKGKDILDGAKLISQEVKSTYEPFLVREDWKNIDLLIFYLQTGRADTLKEALVLADRQRQTDAVVNEISKATKSITSAIQASSQAIVTGIKYATSTINTNLTTLIEMTEMQNALARHSNRKIEDLIKEVDRLEMPSIVDVRVRN